MHNVLRLPEHDAFAVIQLVGIGDQSRDPIEEAYEADQGEQRKRDQVPLGGLTVSGASPDLHGRATISICFPMGFTGEFR